MSKRLKTSHHIANVEHELGCSPFELLFTNTPEIAEIILFKSNLKFIENYEILENLLTTSTTLANIVLGFFTTKRREIEEVKKICSIQFKVNLKNYKVFCNPLSVFIKLSKFNIHSNYKQYLTKLVRKHYQEYNKQDYNPLSYALKLIQYRYNFTTDNLNKIITIFDIMNTIKGANLIHKTYGNNNIKKITSLYCKLNTIDVKTYIHSKLYKDYINFIKDYLIQTLFTFGVSTYKTTLEKYKIKDSFISDLIDKIPELSIYADKYSMKFNSKIVITHLKNSTELYLKENLYKYPIESQTELFKMDNYLINYVNRKLQFKILKDPQTNILELLKKKYFNRNLQFTILQIFKSKMREYLKYTTNKIQRDYLSINDEIMIPKWLKYTSPQVQLDEIKCMPQNIIYSDYNIQLYLYERNTFYWKKYIPVEIIKLFEKKLNKNREILRINFSYLNKLLTVE